MNNTVRDNRTNKLLRVICILFIGLLIHPKNLYAHGLDAGMAVLRLSGKVVYVTATPSQTLFENFDKNRDGKIDKAELQDQRSAILTFFQREFTMRNELGDRGQPIFEDVSLPHSHTADNPGFEVKHLTFNLRYRFVTEPKFVDVHYLSAERSPLRTQAQKYSAAKALTDQRPLGPAISGVLNSSETVVRFFHKSGSVQRISINTHSNRGSGRTASVIIAAVLALSLIRLLRKRGQP